MIDEGTLLVLQSANGAFSCRTPPMPKDWNPVDRPHVANLVSLGRDVFRVYLSTPLRRKGTMKYTLAIAEIDTLPSKSIIEIRHDNVEYSYYRRDERIWTKVAESSSPFMIEVFSHGTSPIIVDIATK
ncbi:MAG: hypothetical protein P1Q69_18725 [Candidatus Thorarchaeota archaeon]|nr:hypothetical protein [Candidatus Thorarchaeota archaeon]